MKQVLSIGKITKKTYCPNCFSILSWDSPEIEKNGVLKCPTCGSLLVKKVLKKGDVIACSNMKCGYKKEPEQVQE